MLTPIEISHKQFSRVMRGYNTKEVDEFLERVGASVEGLINEKAALISELESLKENLGRYHTIEDTLQNTLVMAQRTAEETVKNSRKQAELIEEDARRRGLSLEDEARKRIQNLRDDFDHVKGSQRSFVVQFKAMIDAFYAEIDRFGMTSNGED
jgi:cell division initiation protein